MYRIAAWVLGSLTRGIPATASVGQQYNIAQLPNSSSIKTFVAYLQVNPCTPPCVCLIIFQTKANGDSEVHPVDSGCISSLLSILSKTDRLPALQWGALLKTLMKIGLGEVSMQCMVGKF